MATKCYRLYGSSTGGYIDIARPGKLFNVSIAMSCVPSAVGSIFMDGEVSFSGASSLATTNPVGPIATALLSAWGATSGLAQTSVNTSTDMDVPVKTGDRLYFHFSGSGTSSNKYYISLYVNE